MDESPNPTSDGPTNPLDLESLDADSLFAALGAVEQSIPVLLGHVKPILSHLQGQEVEDVASSAEEYMILLDKIQFVLRQTIYYLRETNSSTTALRPPLASQIPTPFSTTLPSASAGAGPSQLANDPTSSMDTDGPSLGLYGLRMEGRTLREMKEVLDRLRSKGVLPNGSTEGGHRAHANGNGDSNAHDPGEGIDIEEDSAIR